MYYEGFGKNEGRIVSEEDAYGYAMEQVYNEEDNGFSDFIFDIIEDDMDLSEKFVNWFYSSDWIIHDGWPD